MRALLTIIAPDSASNGRESSYRLRGSFWSLESWWDRPSKAIPRWGLGMGDDIIFKLTLILFNYEKKRNLRVTRGILVHQSATVATTCLPRRKRNLQEKENWRGLTIFSSRHLFSNEIRSFINWKPKEKKKEVVIYLGSKWDERKIDDRSGKWLIKADI